MPSTILATRPIVCSFVVKVDVMTLREIFRHAKSRILPKEWLYLPADAEWTLDTNGLFLDWECEEKDKDDIPLVAKRNNLRETLDDGTIEQIVDWADRLAGKEDDPARLDVFRYYFRFDAFPDRLGAPDPPPAHEIMRRLDLEFYDSLGSEHAGTKCRHEGCSRSTTKFSVFCRVHQFEQVKKKTCPFQH
jgi:hypothetical protein